MIARRRDTQRVRLPLPHYEVDEIAEWRFTSFGDVVAVAAHPEDGDVVLYLLEGRTPLTEATAFLSPRMGRAVAAALLAAVRHADAGGGL
ncbi:MAG TPA: hypothetical protein VJ870_04620 [Amycolatopsis sp.]|nr:hypothetical protein [Amycolatopsis sp.]